MSSNGPRRGSSLFSAGAGGSAPSGGQAPKGGGGGGPAKRSSVVLQPMGPGGALGFGIDFDDSDYEDSDDEGVPHGGPYAGQPMSAPSGTGTGGPNHRPLVGGFAAAAYEAAKAHHYQNVAKQQTAKGGKPGQPPKSSQSRKPY